MLRLRTWENTICRAVALLLLWFSGVAYAATIIVPADHLTIQAAIDAAVSGPDEIVVAPGTYNETINFHGKQVHLRSSAGPDVTIIDAGGIGRTVTCNSGEVAATILEGFTITGGDATNQAPDNEGGGMLNLSTRPTVINCIFLNNAAGAGGGMFNSGNAIVTNCRFIGNSATQFGGGMYNPGSPTISNCHFQENTAPWGGAMRNTSFVFNGNSTVTVNRCDFVNNTADFGGAIYSGAAGTSTSMPRFTHCTFSENNATSTGGAMYQTGNSDARATNCLFAGNSANDAGAIHLSGTSVAMLITSCTAFANTSTSGAAVHNTSTGSVNISNSIFWNNAPGQIVNSTGTCAVNYSIVEGGWIGAGGAGVLNLDPQFVDADGADNIPGTVDDNLRLSAGSPAIDAGRNSSVPGTLTTDLDGNPRKIDDPATADTGSGTAPLVDMGAYEKQLPIACPADLVAPAGVIDVFDLFVLLGNWGTAGLGAELAAPTNVVDVFDLFVLLSAWGDC